MLSSGGRYRFSALAPFPICSADAVSACMSARRLSVGGTTALANDGG
jgi:hypothetical protein